MLNKTSTHGYKALLASTSALFLLLHVCTPRMVAAAAAGAAGTACNCSTTSSIDMVWICYLTAAVAAAAAAGCICCFVGAAELRETAAGRPASLESKHPMSLMFSAVAAAAPAGCIRCAAGAAGAARDSSV
jgi:hypothetical protein